MTATRPGKDDIDTGDGDEVRPVRSNSGWMVDVATRRVFRVTPKGPERDAPAAEGNTSHETWEGGEK